MGSVHVICISLLFFKLLYYSPPTVKFYFYCPAFFKKITDSFFSVLSRPRFFHSCNHGQKVFGQLSVSGAFYNSNRSNPNKQQTTNNVGRVYPEFFPSFNFVWGGGVGGGGEEELQENFEKDALL